MAQLLDPTEVMFTSFEPKMSNRFIMYIEGIPAYLVKAANRPEIANGKVTIDHINVRRYVKGRSEWSSLTISLYDPVVPSAAQAAMEWVRLHHESVTGRDGYSDFYKKDLTINVLGPVGDIVSEWILKGAFITSTNFGEYSWDTVDTAINLQITVSIDYAVLNF